MTPTIPPVSRRFQLSRRTPWLALGALLLGCAVAPTSAQTALPDTTGATSDLNIAYGSNDNTYFGGTTGHYFLLENQDSAGWTGILNAAKDNNLSAYSSATPYVDWGWRRQASDGSIPYNGNGGADWQQYHSLATFCAQGGWAVLHLQASPLASNSTVAANISTYIGKLHKSALWLTNNSDYLGAHEGTGTGQVNVQQDGKDHDGPFSHRRMMLASVCFQVAALKPTSTYYNALITQGTAYANEGLACPLPSGTKAVLLPQNSDGSYPVGHGYLYQVPGSYVPPTGISLNIYQGTPPANATIISARAVTPEQGGFDLTYQTDYVTLGVYAADSCPDTNLKNQMYAQFDKSLLWISTRLKNNCTDIDSTGSTRVGVEDSPTGDGLKVVNPRSVRQAFLLMATRSRNTDFADARDTNGNLILNPDGSTPASAKRRWHQIYDNLSARIDNNPHYPASNPNGDTLAADGSNAPWTLGTFNYN